MHRGQSASAVVKNRIPVVGAFLLRHLTVLFIACAFFLQSYAVQTHIHGVSPEVGQIVKLVPHGAAPTAGKSAPTKPGQDSPDDCPLCQAAFHANAVFLDAPVAILPSLVILSPVIVLIHRAFYALYRGHDEAQRGPPQS